MKSIPLPVSDVKPGTIFAMPSRDIPVVTILPMADAEEEIAWDAIVLAKAA